MGASLARVDGSRASTTVTNSKSKIGVAHATIDSASVVLPTIDLPLARPITEASKAAARRVTMVVANPGMGKSFQSGRIPKTSNMVTSHTKAPKPARSIRRNQARGREAV
jgi:hypothetical protein